MTEENVKAQEGAGKEGDKSKVSGDLDKFASKEELAALLKSVEEQGRKTEQIFGLITSPDFMGRNAPPAPTTVKVEEKGLAPEEVDELKPHQLLQHALKEVSKMLEKNNAMVEENLKNVAASIKQVSDAEADKDATRQITQVKSDYGEDEFEKFRPAMVKIVAETPGITAERAFLIARGEADPVKKKAVPKGTPTEKPGQLAEFTDTNLKPSDAAEKAYRKAFGDDNNPI
jgi:uncharacterized protein YqgV (UPF0045/DUF77 family)